MSLTKEEAKKEIDETLADIAAKFDRIAELGVEHQIHVTWEGLEGYGDRAWLVLEDRKNDGWGNDYQAGQWQASANSC